MPRAAHPQGFPRLSSRDTSTPHELPSHSLSIRLGSTIPRRMVDSGKIKPSIGNKGLKSWLEGRKEAGGIMIKFSFFIHTQRVPVTYFREEIAFGG